MRILARYLLLLIIVNSSFAQAPSKQNSLDSALNERTQLEFCATYAPCAIAVGFMNAAETGMNFTDKVKAYIRTFGNSPIRSEQEFRSYLSTLSASQRQEYVSKCLSQRGTNMRDYCEESYLLDSELKSLKASRSSQSPDVTKESAMRARKVLVDKDTDLMSVLGPSCKMTESGPSYGCSTLLEVITKFDRDIGIFNKDLDILKFVPPFESAAINKILTMYDKENDRGTIKWIPKSSLPVKTDLPVADPKSNPPPVLTSNSLENSTDNETWKSLPSRPSDSVVDKQLENVLSSSRSGSTSDPYAGTSSKLNPDEIELERQRYSAQNAQNLSLLNGLLSAAIAYKSGGKTKALEAFIQSQTERDANSESNNNTEASLASDNENSTGSGGSNLQLSCTDSFETYLSTLPNFSSASVRSTVAAMRNDVRTVLNEVKAKKITNRHISEYQRLQREMKTNARIALENHKNTTMSSGSKNTMCNPSEGTQAMAWAASQLGAAYFTWAVNIAQCALGRTGNATIPEFCPF